MRVETTTTNRKEMAHALAEHLHTDCVYLRTPSYAYRVGGLTVEHDGAIEGEARDLLEIADWLLEHGLILKPIQFSEEPDSEPASEAISEPTVDDSETSTEPVTHTCVFLRLASFTPLTLKNLLRMLYARQRLISEMTRSTDIEIGIEVITTLESDALTELPILERVLRESIDHGFIKGIYLDDGLIGLGFPHDEDDPTRWQHYAKLLQAIVDKAQTTKRVSTYLIEPEDSEMKYCCHSFLMQLGLQGAKHSETRHVLLDHLQGYAAFKSNDRMEAHKARVTQRRRAAREAADSVCDDKENACEMPGKEDCNEKD